MTTEAIAAVRHKNGAVSNLFCLVVSAENAGPPHAGITNARARRMLPLRALRGEL